MKFCLMEWPGCTSRRGRGQEINPKAIYVMAIDFSNSSNYLGNTTHSTPTREFIHLQCILELSLHCLHLFLQLACGFSGLHFSEEFD